MSADLGLDGTRLVSCIAGPGQAARQVFRDALTVDDAAWSRGRGWALQLGLMAAAYAADDPVLGDMGRRTVAEVLKDFRAAA